LALPSEMTVGDRELSCQHACVHSRPPVPVSLPAPSPGSPFDIIPRGPTLTKNQSGQVRASLNTMCPKCGATITPDLVKRLEFERIECPKRGKKFRPSAALLP